MQHLQLTLDTPAENLALDEALLDAAEAGEIDTGVLRLWESPTYCVVLGRSSPVETEVHLDACRHDFVPVLRRSSGGGTIVAGPGCLMYALVLSLRDYPQLQAIDQAHQFFLEKLSRMLSTNETPVARLGTSDLAIRPSTTGPKQNVWQKFSGNAIRLKRNHILYHGTLLYDFDLECLPRWLATPTRTPDYRDERQHTEFVTNLKAEREALVETLVETLVKGWQSQAVLSAWPEQRTLALVDKKYTDDPKWAIYAPCA